jgi:flagellar basal-body rod protein FlgG
MAEIDGNASQIGQVEIARFVNPTGLMAIGGNLYQQSAASGDAIVGTPGSAGFGKIMQGSLESSNVDVVDEMVNLIVAQRAYELNSKAVSTSDNMLSNIANMKQFP